MKVIFSKNAIKSLHEIIDCLHERWSPKEIKTLNADLEKLIQSFKDRLISYPIIYSGSETRFALIAKRQVKVYFELHEETVEILLFLPSKGDPDHILKLLNHTK